MGKEKIKNELQKIMKNKNMRIPIIICLICVFLLLTINVFQNTNILNGKKLTVTEKSNNIKEISNQDDNPIESQYDYEEKQKIDLKNILKKMQGVGDVDVMISFESGESKLPAYDKNEQKSVTEESDTRGGKRVNNQNNDNSKVVMTTQNGKNEPFILKTYKPKIIGVVVVAEGASNSKTKYEIEQAVSKLYNLTLDKVNVYSMKK